VKTLTDRVLDLAKTLGASYADVRFSRLETQSITVKNGNVEALSSGESQGFGVRVIVDGAWGFASSSRFDDPVELDRVTALAARIARASGLARRAPVNLGPPVVHTGTYRTPIKQDPFAVPLDQRVAVLLKADEAMGRVKGVAVRESGIDAYRETKTFANSEGSYIEQVIVQSGCGIEATAVGEGELQKRSYPNSFGRHWTTEGYELVERMDLPGNAERIAEEAWPCRCMSPAAIRLSWTASMGWRPLMLARVS